MVVTVVIQHASFQNGKRYESEGEGGGATWAYLSRCAVSTNWPEPGWFAAESSASWKLFFPSGAAVGEASALAGGRRSDEEDVCKQMAANKVMISNQSQPPAQRRFLRDLRGNL